MSEPKTKRTGASVEDFLNSVEHDRRREESFVILELMREVTGEEPAMWGPSIVGFGAYQYKYASGREGDWPLVGFSPRKRQMTLYIMTGFDEYEAILERLGTYRTGKSCLYVNKLADIDLEVLRELVVKSVGHMKESGR